MSVDPPDDIEPAEQTVVPEGSLKRRARWIWAIAGVVAVAVVITIGLITFRGGSGGSPDIDVTTSSPKCEESSKNTGVTKPAKPAKSDRIKVSDTGVTVGSVYGGDGSPIVYGVELTNPSKLVAKEVKVTLTVVDSGGSPLPSHYDVGETLNENMAIPYIMPGHNFGVGGKGLTPELKPDEKVKLKIDVKVAEWWKVDNDVHEFPLLTAKIDAGSTDDVKYSVNSNYCVPAKEPKVGVLIRDTDNNIITGNDPGIIPHRVTSEDPKSFPSGTSKGWYTDFLLPEFYDDYFDAEPDPMKSQVFPYIKADDDK